MTDDLTDLWNDIAAMRSENADIRARVDGLPLPEGHPIEGS
jgi:hypothetical protein